jgi:hypothetical protein
MRTKQLTGARVIGVAGALAAAACAGDIGDAASAGSGGVDPAPSAAAPERRGGPGDGTVAPGGLAGGPAPAAGGPAAPANLAPPSCASPGGPAPVRRLTRREYNNTVRDLLGDTSEPADQFAADGVVGAFESNAESVVTSLLAADYESAAETLASRLDVDSILPCRPAPGGAGDEACARTFIGVFGKRAFRRPLAAAEIDRYVRLYAGARGRGHDFAGGVRLVVQAFLQSPHFLHHIERGGAGGAVGAAAPLSPHELASRLAYLLWQTMPDAPLVALADAGRLGSPDELEREARRLLADPRARRSLRAFYTQWLELGELDGLQKSTTAFPLFRTRPDAGKLMRAETEAFVDAVLWDGDGRLATLLAAPFSFVNSVLAGIYGLAGVTGEALRRVALDPRQRAGVLTQPGFLAHNAYSEQTSPVHRGKFVRERLLCQEIPSPPPDFNPQLPEPNPELTTRQRYQVHLDDPYCGPCHRLMNPLGLSMESYNAIGRFRLTEGGLPIDATAELTGTRDADGRYDGLVELAGRLAKSADVRDCAARSWFSFALGRREAAADRCAIDRLAADFSASGGDLRALVIASVRNDAFRFRAPLAPEVCR